MKEPYIAVNGVAQVETAKAFCIKDASFIIDGVSTEVSGDTWIPKYFIMDDSLDEISEASRGDDIEIFAQKSWLRDNV